MNIRQNNFRDQANKTKWNDLLDVYDLNCEQDTIDLAEKVADLSEAGDVIALYGELGAGKTFFTQQFCRALGILEPVSSPSYVLINLYEGDIAVTHADLYRLSASEEVLELGLDEMFNGRITLIEWPEIAEDLLPENTLHIRIEFTDKARKAFIMY